MIARPISIGLALFALSLSGCASCCLSGKGGSSSAPPTPSTGALEKANEATAKDIEQARSDLKELKGILRDMQELQERMEHKGLIPTQN